MPKTGIRPYETKTRGRQWMAYYRRDGRQINRRGFRTAHAAERWRADAMINAASPADSRITVGEWVTEWLGQHRNKIGLATYERYAGVLRNYIIPYLGPIRIRALSHRHIETMHFDAVAMGRSSSTVRNNHAPLRLALTMAVRDGLISTNPASLVRLPKQQETEIEVFTLEEMCEFLDGNRDDELYPIYHLALWTGMRLGELLALRVGRDIDLFSRVITVREKVRKGVTGPPKSRAGRRRVPISTEAAGVLGRAIHDRADGERAFDFEPNTVSRSMTRACERAGVKRIRFHDLRHTHATHLLAAGENINAVSERMGHADVGITLRTYAHVLPGMSEGLGEATERVFARDATKMLSRAEPESALVDNASPAERQ